MLQIPARTWCVRVCITKPHLRVRLFFSSVRDRAQDPAHKSPVRLTATRRVPHPRSLRPGPWTAVFSPVRAGWQPLPALQDMWLCTTSTSAATRLHSTNAQVRAYSPGRDISTALCRRRRPPPPPRSVHVPASCNWWHRPQTAASRVWQLQLCSSWITTMAMGTERGIELRSARLRRPVRNLCKSNSGRGRTWLWALRPQPQRYRPRVKTAPGPTMSSDSSVRCTSGSVSRACCRRSVAPAAAVRGRVESSTSSTSQRPL